MREAIICNQRQLEAIRGNQRMPSMSTYLMREAILCNQHALELELVQSVVGAPVRARMAIICNQGGTHAQSACARTCPGG